MSSKLERLLNLLAALLDAGQPRSAEWIGRNVEGYPEGRVAFRRAFERDKEELREMGIPLQLVPIPASEPPEEGYLVDRRRYQGPEPDLAPDELAALHLAASLVRVEGLDEDGAFWKLGGVPDGETPAAGPPLAALPGDPNLAALFGAAAERRQVELVYNGVHRRIDPLRLSFARGHWYLAGIDHVRDEERSYRVDRIQGRVVPTTARFERPADRPGRGTAPPGWELGDADPVEARILIDADQAAWARTHVGPSAVIEERPDGSIVLALMVANREALRSFVLSFLDHAEILSPAELRTDLVTWLESFT